MASPTIPIQELDANGPAILARIDRRVHLQACLTIGSAVIALTAIAQGLLVALTPYTLTLQGSLCAMGAGILLWILAWMRARAPVCRYYARDSVRAINAHTTRSYASYNSVLHTILHEHGIGLSGDVEVRIARGMDTSTTPPRASLHIQKVSLPLDPVQNAALILSSMRGLGSWGVDGWESRTVLLKGSALTHHQRLALAARMPMRRKAHTQTP